MATTNPTSAANAVHQAAVQLAALDWLDQEAARQLSPLAEAVANMFMVVYYQAETGQLSRADFEEARVAVEQSLQQAPRASADLDTEAGTG